VKTSVDRILRALRPAGGCGAVTGRFTAGWLLVLTAFTPAQGAPPVGRIVPDLAALAREASIILPPPPVWDAKSTATLWTIDDLTAEFGKITDTPPRINFIRTNLLRPDHTQLVDFKNWFRKLEKPLKMHFVEQLWDCDNYANCFVAFADLLALRAGETRGSICIGWASVFYRFKFAGIRAGGAHAVVILGTSQGLFIVEPQDGTMVALRDFPNRHTIEEVYF
jgi:hypothetical protein